MSNKIVVVHKCLDPDSRVAIEKAAAKYGCSVEFYVTEEEAIPHLADADILYGQGNALLAAAPNLKWFCSLSAGVEGYLAPGVIDPEKTLLSSSSGAYGVTISEHIVMVTLMLLRQQMAYNEIIRGRKWVRSLPVRSIRDSRIVILGTGDLGREAARRFTSFNPASVTGVSRSGRSSEKAFDKVLPVSQLDEILPETDILVLCLPRTKETDDLLCGKLSLLPSHAILVNVGRGNVLDEDELMGLLKEGKLGGAALDVFRQEPLPVDSPLFDCPNLLITPHVAGDMSLGYTVRRGVELFLEDLDNYFAGKPLGRQVSWENGY